MARGDKIRNIYRSIKEIKKGSIINVKKTSDDAGCTVPYSSHVLKMARVEKIIGIDDEGNYIKITKLPEFEEFKTRVNAQIKAYRKEVGGTGKRSGTLSGPIEVNAKNLVIVIKQMAHEHRVFAEENVELKKKLKLLKEYIKKNVS